MKEQHSNSGTRAEDKTEPRGCFFSVWEIPPTFFSESTAVDKKGRPKKDKAQDSRRLVFMAVANYGGRYGNLACPAISTLMRETGRGERTVQRALEWLAAAPREWISIDLKAGVGKFKGNNRYPIHLDRLPRQDGTTTKGQPATMAAGSDAELDEVNPPSEGANPPLDEVNPPSEGANPPLVRHPIRRSVIKQEKERETETSLTIRNARPSSDQKTEIVGGVCSRLFDIGRRQSGRTPAFVASQRQAVAEFLAEGFTPSEICEAYGSLIAEFDDFQMASAPKQFAEAGQDVLQSLRRKRREQQEQEAQLARLRDTMSDRVAEEIRKLDEADAAEAELVEEEFQTLVEAGPK